jgi:glycosyltransferase involved in cell wall biosynthesis
MTSDCLEDAAGSVGQRVLLFSVNYWPEQTGTAPSSTALAEHLAASGMHVNVVAGMPYYPQCRTFDEYRGHLHLQESRAGVTVDRYRQYVPAKQSAAHRALFEGTFLANGLRALRRPRPDLIVGVLPNLGAGILAAAAARRYRVPYGLIVQDLVGRAVEQSGIRGGGSVARLTSRVEGWVARGAASTAIVAEDFRAPLGRLGVEPGRITVLPNWTHIPAPHVPRDIAREHMGWRPDDRIVLHAGNMGLKQGLQQVIDAARIARSAHPSLRFVLLGHGNQRRALEAAAGDLPNVDFIDPVSEQWFPEALSAADVLLVTQRADVTDMSLPSKLTSYFVVGRPVVTAANEGSAAAAVTRQSGAGIVVPPEDPPALLEGILRLTADARLSTCLGTAGARFAHQHLTADEALDRARAFVIDIARQGGVGVIGTSVTAKRVG